MMWSIYIIGMNIQIFLQVCTKGWGVYFYKLCFIYTRKKKKKEIVFTLGDGYNIITPEHWRSRALREEKTVFYSFYTTNVQNASTYIWVTILQNNKKQRRKKADMNGNKIYTSLTQ